MEVSEAVSYYNKVMCAENEGELVGLTIEIQCAVINKVINDEMEMMMLNLAIQVKKQTFLMTEMLMSNNLAAMFANEDFDPEAAQLEQFHEEEFEEFKNNEGVLTMSDFTKREK